MRVEITDLDKLPADRGLKVTVGEERIALFKIDGSVYAIGDRCSHAEASLAEGELWDRSVECPRHGSEFDLETGVPASLPATAPVPVYDVVIEDGKVFLDMESS